MKSYFVLLFLLCIGLTASNLHAQEFEDFVKKYTGANGKGFMQPLADAFGANLNSGWYHSAYIAKPGFQLYIGVSAMAAPIPAKNRTFTATTEGFFTPQQQAEVPTIFGGTEIIKVYGEGTGYQFPTGIDIQRAPMAVPNITIGSLLGTTASFRWAAYDLGKEIGKIELVGWGISHSVSQYLPLEPFDVALGYYMNQFGVGDVVDAMGWIASIQASYQWHLFTLYGGLGYENSTLDINYIYEEDGSEVAFDLEGNNKMRGTIGLTLNLGPVKLNSDYSVARQSIFSVGFGLGFNETKKKGR
jgi:hypothetical protein